jgi:hypothetical protein
MKLRRPRVKMLALITVALMLPALSRVAAESNNSSGNDDAGDIDLARLLIRTYDISSGQLRWERRVDGSPWSSAVKGDQLFISGWGTHPGTGHIDYTLRAFRIDGEDGDDLNQW